MADPEKWGPGLWRFLHSLPRYGESVESTRAVLAHLDLPCPDCRKHYRGFLAAHPVGGLATREALEDWIFRLHNEVNGRLGKTQYGLEQCRRDCEELSKAKIKAEGVRVGPQGLIFG